MHKLSVWILAAAIALPAASGVITDHTGAAALNAVVTVTLASYPNVSITNNLRKPGRLRSDNTSENSTPRAVRGLSSWP